MVLAYAAAGQLVSARHSPPSTVVQMEQAKATGSIIAIDFDSAHASVVSRLFDLSAGCALLAGRLELSRGLLTCAIDGSPTDGQRAHLMQQVRTGLSKCSDEGYSMSLHVHFPCLSTDINSRDERADKHDKRRQHDRA
jgi:hypothetical protein